MSTFLAKEELKTVADINLVNKITALDDTIVEDIILESIETMKGYLSKYYDIDAIFTATGDTRHKVVVKFLKYITIYEIYERHTREQNAVAARRFAEAMDWLEKLNKGEYFDRTLPIIPKEITTAPEGSTGDNRYGGNTQYTSNY